MGGRAAPPPARVGLVGLGLIGGSIAQGLRRAWPQAEICGVDTRETAARARDAGAITSAAATIRELAGVDLVVFATPVGAIVDGLSSAAVLEDSTVVTDTGSTKRAILRAAADAGVARFVGGHPMAGGEHGGLANARADLFAGRPWIIVPPNPPAPDAEALVETMVLALGARPVRMDARDHDRVMAHVSHVPQLLSSALMASAAAAIGAAGLRAAGQGFRDMTRLASSPSDIWADILSTNADFVIDALRALAAALPADDAAVGDAARITALFAEALTARETMTEQAPL